MVCKVGHHKTKNSKPLYGLPTALVYHTLPETARGRIEFAGGGRQRERTWTNRAFQTLDKNGPLRARNRGGLYHYQTPRKRGSIVPHDKPGMRRGSVSLRDCFHARRESRSHRKQSRASRAGVYTLLQNAYWVLNPNSGKGPPSAAFSSSLTGRLRVLPGASNHEVYSQPVKPPVFSARKGA